MCNPSRILEDRIAEINLNFRSPAQGVSAGSNISNLTREHSLIFQECTTNVLGICLGLNWKEMESFRRKRFQTRLVLSSYIVSYHSIVGPQWRRAHGAKRNIHVQFGEEKSISHKTFVIQFFLSLICAGEKVVYSFGCGQPMTVPTWDSCHELETMLDATWSAKHQRLDIAET